MMQDIKAGFLEDLAFEDAIFNFGSGAPSGVIAF